ncbi:MAG: right-handed parallel beta-helix repeat-containing protein, partial [Clostridia bacterium]|nr:right-handed parallel beta-helix repeat-containing protein [Clostridia bacterium]
MRVVNVTEHGINPSDSRENVLLLRRILEENRDSDPMELYFPKGTYHFYPDYAVEKLLFISNHDEDTIKRIAFDLTGYQGIHIRGEQAEFIFHTDIIPFYLHQCSGVTISGITIDYERPAYSEGRIRKVSERYMELEIDKKEYPYIVQNGRIYFQGENFCNELVNGWLEMDAKRMAPVYKIKD